MHTSKSIIFAVASTLALAACNNQPATAPAASSAPEAQQAVSDSNAINAAIPAEAFKVKLSLEGQPALSADGATATYSLRVENSGTASLYGVGSAPFNVGAQILGTDNTAEPANGGVRDFGRAPLPLIEAGKSVTVPISIPANNQLNGRKIRFSLVQEGIAWHDDAESSVEVNAPVVADGKFGSAAQ